MLQKTLGASKLICPESQAQPLHYISISDFLLVITSPTEGEKETSSRLTLWDQTLVWKPNLSLRRSCHFDGQLGVFFILSLHSSCWSYSKNKGNVFDRAYSSLRVFQFSYCGSDLSDKIDWEETVLLMRSNLSKLSDYDFVTELVLNSLLGLGDISKTMM